MKFQERIKNMLSTLAVGDALGKICSKYTVDDILEIYGHKIDHLVKPIRNSSFEWYVGAITDDTILTLLVADSLITNRDYCRSDIAKRMIDCDPRGGSQIKKLKASGKLNYVATDGNTNGAAIRVSALSIVSRNIEQLVANVITLSNLTHGTSEAITAALLVALVQHHFLYIDSDASLLDARLFVEKTFSLHYKLGLSTRTFETFQQVVDAAIEITDTAKLCSKIESHHGYDKYAWSSVPTGVILGIYAKDSYNMLQHIIHRTQSGCDLDSVASIAGSIMGIRMGNQYVADMARIIESANEIDFASYANELCRLAEGAK